MKNKLKRIVSMLLCAMLLCGLLPLAAAAGDTGTVEQKLYVSKNMVLWADGANNWNGSHRTDAEDWKDLSGSRNSLYLFHIVDREDHFEHHWEDNGLYIDPQRGGFIECSGTQLRDSLVVSHSFTVELVLGDITWEETASPVLFSTFNGAIKLTAARNQNGTVDLTFQIGEAEGDYVAARATVEDLSGITLAVTVDEDRNAFNSLLYVNGEKVGEGKTVNFTREDVELFIFGYTEEEGRWGGLLHGIRMYTRALSSEELAANAAADSFNYREGNVIEPVQRYDPYLDQFITGWYGIDCVDSNDRIPINGETDMIPLRGFYGSTNLWEYLYPVPSDDVSWEGARIARAEDLEQDFEGKPIPYVWFYLRYDVICNRAGLKPLSVGETQYVVLAYRADGEIDGVGVTAVCYDVETQAEIHVPCTTRTVSPITGDGTGDVQYLVFEVGQWEHESYKMTEEDYLSSLKVQIDGLEEDDVLYLTELSLFATEAEMCAYTGLPYTEPPADSTPAPDADGDVTNPQPETEPASDETEGTDVPETGDEQGTEAPTDDSHAPADGDTVEGGCSSLIGFGAVAILTAIAAAVALKKRAP